MTQTTTGWLQSIGWVFFDWKNLVDGGKVAAYKIQPRERPSGPWSDAGMAIESEISLSDQERDNEWEYSVSAVNTGCDGESSNNVMAVL